MNPIEFRPFTADERRALAELASSRGELAHDLLTGGGVFAVVLGLGVLVVRCVSGPPSGPERVVLAAFAAVLALTVLWKIRRSLGRALAGARADYAADLAGGRATTETFDATDAIAVAELEDEGAAYYLRLADGRVLFLGGQYLDKRADFPCTRFAVTRAPRSRIVLALECAGTRLEPSARRPPFTRAEHEAERVPADGAIVAVDFESLRGA